MPTLDPVKNLGVVVVSAGYSDTDTSIVLQTGDGSKLPDPSGDGAYNLVWFNSTDYPAVYDDPNVEIVRVTAKSTDTLTVTRAQEGTSASTKNTGGKTYKMVLAPTKKLRDDIETVFGSPFVLISASTPLASERVLTGTANQITVTDNGAGSTVVLSTPQNLHTSATPTFGGLIVNGNIGVTADTDLLQLAANALTLNGALTMTGDLQVLQTTGGELARIRQNSGGTYNLGFFFNVNDTDGSWKLDFSGGSVGGVANLAVGNTNVIQMTSAQVVTLTGDLRVDGGDIGTTSDTDLLGLAANALTVRGSVTASKAGVALDIQNTTDAASNQVAIFRANDRTTAANNDEGYFSFHAETSTGASAEFARMTWTAADKTNASKNGIIRLEVMNDDSFGTDKGLTISGAVAEDDSRIRVGVNVASPSYAFQVNGDIVSTTNGGIAVGSTAVGTSHWFSVARNIPHTTNAAYNIGGGTGVGFTGAFGNVIGSSPDINAGYSYARVLLATATVNEAGSGNHPLIAHLAIKPLTITGGTATVSNTAMIYVESAMSATVSGANYAVWIDAGLSRFDGDGTYVFELPADATDPTAGGGAAAGRIPVKISGATKYLAYY